MSKTKITKQQIDLVAEYLQSAGRRGDNELAHLTTGEIVLPKSVIAKLDPKILAAAFKAADRDIKRYTVGGSDDSINPETNLREYFEGSTGADSHGSNSSGQAGNDSGNSTGGSTGGNDGGLSFGTTDPGGTDYSGSSTDRGGLGDNPGDDSVGGDGTDGLSFGLADDGSGNSGPSTNYSGYSTDKGGLGVATQDTVSYGGKDEGTRATESKAAAAPGQGPNATATYGTHGYGKNSIEGGKMAGALGRFAGLQLDKAVENPIATAINTVIGLVPGIGLVNTISGLLDGPTIGGGVTSAGRGATDIATSLGVSTPGVSFDTDPTDPNGVNDARGGGEQAAQQAQAVEVATQQAATTLSNTPSLGTIARDTATKRRSFSKLTFGNTANSTASLLW